MKVKLIVFIMFIMLMLTGCNKQIIDTKWKFDKAIITVGNTTLEVEVQSWRDYDDTSIQITTVDGKTYLTDLKNVLLISE